MHLLLQTQDVLLEVGTTGGGHDLAAHVLGDLNANLTCLQGELTGWNDDQSLDLVESGVDTLEDRNDIGASLSSTVLGSGQDITTSQSDRDARLNETRQQLTLATRTNITTKNSVVNLYLLDW